jgi:hypothetical protein
VTSVVFTVLPIYIQVISSAKHGRNVFVGCVVTNASKSSVVLGKFHPFINVLGCCGSGNLSGSGPTFNEGYVKSVESL